MKKFLLRVQGKIYKIFHVDYSYIMGYVSERNEQYDT